MRKSLLGALATLSGLVLVSATAFADQSAGDATPIGGQQFIAPGASSAQETGSTPAPAQNAPASQTAEAPTGRRPLPFPPAPLDSPPAAWSDWPFGGTALIGGATPNSSGGAVMKALSGTSFGDYLKDHN